MSRISNWDWDNSFNYSFQRYPSEKELTREPETRKEILKRIEIQKKLFGKVLPETKRILEEAY